MQLFARKAGSYSCYDARKKLQERLLGASSMDMEIAGFDADLIDRAAGS